MDDDKVFSVKQYSVPPMWWEWSIYGCTIALLCAYMFTHSVLTVATLTGMLLYWNFLLFKTLREYVRHVNTSEFSRLLTMLAESELNKHKDGTFQDSSCLTKEHGDEETPSTKGD